MTMWTSIIPKEGAFPELKDYVITEEIAEKIRRAFRDAKPDPDLISPYKGNKERCMFDGVEPNTVTGISCNCPKCSPR